MYFGRKGEADQGKQVLGAKFNLYVDVNYQDNCKTKSKTTKLIKKYLRQEQFNCHFVILEPYLLQNFCLSKITSAFSNYKLQENMWVKIDSEREGIEVLRKVEVD